MSRFSVEYRRREPLESEVRSGILPSARTWQDMAALANWLAGQGNCLVGGTMIDDAIPEGTLSTLHFMTKPRDQALYRVWTFTLRAESKLNNAGSTVRVRAPALTGAAQTFNIQNSRFGVPYVYIEEISTPSSATADLTIDFLVSADAALKLYIDCLRCFEVPRGFLPSGGGAVSPISERPSERIYAPSSMDASVFGVWETLISAEPWRAGILHWAMPLESAHLPKDINTGVYKDLFALPVPILVPKMDKGATTQVVKWSAYLKLTGGGGGNVRITTSHSGVSDSTTVISDGWTTPRSISVDCEDLASLDGRQTAASPQWDEVQVSFYGYAGSTAYVAAVSIWSEYY